MFIEETKSIVPNPSHDSDRPTRRKQYVTVVVPPHRYNAVRLNESFADTLNPGTSWLWNSLSFLSLFFAIPLM